MKNRNIHSLFYATAISAALLLSSCSDDDDNNPGTGPSIENPDVEFYGLTATNSLLKIDSKNPSTAQTTVPIAGIGAGERLLAIDFRPATGQLYGLSSASKLYTINPITGAANAVGTAFTPTITGDLVGFDFNPTVDRIRVVTSSGLNLRLNPETGAVAATDGNLNPGTPKVGASAYTNNEAGAATTTLYAIDFANSKLYKQDPPNDGKLVEVGALNVTLNATADGGFDIDEDDDKAIAAFTMSGQGKLYSINLETGAASELGNLPAPIIGLAIPTEAVAYAVDLNNNLQIFDFTDTDELVSKPITNLASGENVLGLDMRPATGQLYALGSTGRLYTINMATAAATPVGLIPFGILSGTNFGFDFNPTVDRIRLVSNTGQNLRLNPIDGTLAAADGNLNPGTPDVTSAAYTNSYAGATATTLFTIDTTTNSLFKQDPPNLGTLVSVGALGIDVGGENGFDIGGTSNTAYAALTVGSATKIYSINTSTGATTLVSDYPNAIRAFAVGLGF